MNMVERVARAVARELAIGDEGERKPYRIARAAIEAMREPSEAMVGVGAKRVFDDDEGEWAYETADAYRSMIDEALR